MSRVQFNLLPDSKLEANRAEHTKKLVLTIAILVSVASFVLFLIMLLTVDVVQKKLLNSAATNVDRSSSQLQKLNVDKIITVQNQLQALTGLHQNKHVTSRVFAYLSKITPSNVSINKLDLDIIKSTMSISGTADSQQAVNTFVDNLKYANFKIGDQATSAPAFQSVVETGFNINPGNVGYTIDMQFDPKLFANNLKDANGKLLTPQISVNNPAAGSSTPSSSGTLFNSTGSK
jgi:Tfp pilus assembly protein PilN